MAPSEPSKKQVLIKIGSFQTVIVKSTCKGNTCDLINTSTVAGRTNF